VRARLLRTRTVQTVRVPVSVLAGFGYRQNVYIIYYTVLRNNVRCTQDKYFDIIWFFCGQYFSVNKYFHMEIHVLILMVVYFAMKYRNHLRKQKRANRTQAFSRLTAKHTSMESCLRVPVRVLTRLLMMM
jgi:hypothetical protein